MLRTHLDLFGSFDLKWEVDCRILYSSKSFSHVRHQGISIARNFARHARNVEGFSMWMEDVPPHLNVVFLANLALI